MKSTLPTSNGQHLVLYFQVHQPRRVKKFQFFDIGSHRDYFDDDLNERILDRIARQCYLPTNAMLLELIRKNPSLKISFSISGVTLDQFEAFAPKVIDSFKALARTGNVEFLAETDYHSLASLKSRDEFKDQILRHSEKIKRHLGVVPVTFRNTEMIYSDGIGRQISRMGFRGILCEGIDRILKERSTYHLYHHIEEKSLRILLRSNRLSDDIAFRYIEGGTKLSVDKYIAWLNSIPADEPVVTLGMDYETFGEHHKRETGIVDFLKKVLTRVIKEKKFALSTPADIFSSIIPNGGLGIQEYVSWADESKDTSAWLGNDMQRDAFDTLMGLEELVKRTGHHELVDVWRNLQTSDHFYYMSTKKDNDGGVHDYFSHYSSPYEAFINYMNIVSDFELRVKNTPAQMELLETGNLLEYESRNSNVPVWLEKSVATYKQDFL